MVFQLILSTRPRQWVKNLFVLAALVFSENLFEGPQLWLSLAALGCFCLLSGAVYLVNDVFDREQDRLHPEKSQRPIAAGAISVPVALLAATVFMGSALWISFALHVDFGKVAVLYSVLNLAYSYRLKHVVLIDVMIVASGFLLRALGGALVIGVQISEWFILCSFTLALFLATVKRRQELVKLQTVAAEHRTTLASYDLGYLDQIISVLTSATIVCYALYAMGVGEEGAGTARHMQWTIPFVLYGILRYLYVVYRYEGGDSPTTVVWEDRPLQVTLILWVAVSVFLLYSY